MTSDMLPLLRALLEHGFAGPTHLKSYMRYLNGVCAFFLLVLPVSNVYLFLKADFLFLVQLVAVGTICSSHLCIQRHVNKLQSWDLGVSGILS